MAKFELYTDKAGEYRFRLKAGNGQIILASEGYTSKDGALNGIESVKENSQDDARFERKETATGCKFTLKAGNGQAIGESEVYTSDAACENGVASVAKNAPEAEVVEVD
jgi:uncharacterized protein YegP (UPF0339 family)